MSIDATQFGALTLDRALPDWFVSYQDGDEARFIVGQTEIDILQRLLKQATWHSADNGRYLMRGPNGFRQVFSFGTDCSVTVVGTGGAPSQQIAPGAKIRRVGRAKEGEWIGTCPTRDVGPFYGSESDIRSWALDQSGLHKDAPVVVGPAKSGIQDPCSIYVRRGQIVREHDLEALTSEIRAEVDPNCKATITVQMGMRDYIQSRTIELGQPTSTEAKTALLE